MSGIASSRLKLLFCNPLVGPIDAISRYFVYQTTFRLVQKPVPFAWINGSKLLLKHGMYGASKNFYAGLADREEMGLLLHLLRPDDLFLDGGANVGAYTVLAAAVAGANALAFEPIPDNFSNLMENIRINNVGDRATAIRKGLWSETAELPFSTTLGSEQSRVDHSGRDPSSTTLPVVSLDEILAGRAPLLIKLDTEGSERQILAGAKRTLADPACKAILIELWRSEDLHNQLVGHGFEPFAYDPVSRELKPDPELKVNAIYLRDLTFVRERIQSAPEFNVFGRKF